MLSPYLEVLTVFTTIVLWAKDWT